MTVIPKFPMKSSQHACMDRASTGQSIGTKHQDFIQYWQLKYIQILERPKSARCYKLAVESVEYCSYGKNDALFNFKRLE